MPMNVQMIIIISIVILLAGAGVWFYYFQAQSSSEQLSSANHAAAPAEAVMVDIQNIERELVDLRRLKTLRLDTAVLKDPFLESLQGPQGFMPADSGTTATSSFRDIIPGRPDPFIPF